jgi:hypothetical protein
MRKTAVILLIALLCLVLASCHALGGLADRETDAPEDSAEPARTPKAAASVTPSPAPRATPKPTTQGAAGGPISYTRAVEVFAAPDAFAGREYASPFQLADGAQQMNGISVCYARGAGAENAWAVLDFGAGEGPGLTAGDIVYVRGTIQGEGTIYADDGSEVGVLWLVVNELEVDAANAELEVAERTVTLDAASHSATSGTLTIELLSLEFTADNLWISTRTEDTAVRQRTTYYTDILVHQDGYFAGYFSAEYWIVPGTAGFDNVPLSPLDSGKDLTVEFVPFGEDGAPVCEPLTIAVAAGEH